MDSAELAAARRHLLEVKGLGESQRVIGVAEDRLQAAIDSVAEMAKPEAGVVSLSDAGLSPRIIELLHENSERLEDDRLKTLEGLRSWVEEGNDIDRGLEGIGPKYAKAIAKALRT